MPADRIMCVYGKSPPVDSRPGSAAGPACATSEDSVAAARRVNLGNSRLANPGSLYTTSFSSLAGRNAIFLLAATATASPVAGLRAVSAGRSRTCRMPRPLRRILSPLESCRSSRFLLPPLSTAFRQHLRETKSVNGRHKAEREPPMVTLSSEAMLAPSLALRDAGFVRTSSA